MSMKAMNDIRISIHALLAESDAPDPAALVQAPKFLSTLSLRRATHPGQPVRGLPSNFYPRSPCGERRLCPICQWRRSLISIHALLAESDWNHREPRASNTISIHALLAESDSRTETIATKISDFYPRSPCGERQPRARRASRQQPISIHALLAESDPKNPMIRIDKIPFLSTLSLRRATE